MENLKSVNLESVNGIVYVENKLMKRSLLLMTPDRKVGYNVLAKCRNTDMHSVVKCLVKAQLASMREMFLENANEETMETKHTVTNLFSRPMQCKYIYVTNQNGEIIENSLITCGDKKNLREAFGVKRTDKLYKLVVEQGLPWDNENVVSQMQSLINTIIRQLDYGVRVDKALDDAAASTEKEQDAEEKAAKEAEKAAKAAAKEKGKAVKAAA